jgi:hypothetical protein
MIHAAQWQWLDGRVAAPNAARAASSNSSSNATVKPRTNRIGTARI